VINVQLYLAIGVPILFNATLLGLVIGFFNPKLDALNAKFDAKFDAGLDSVNSRFDAVNSRLDAIDKRFDDMRDLWRAELRRVEDVLDARLKHLEQHR